MSLSFCNVDVTRRGSSHSASMLLMSAVCRCAFALSRLDYWNALLAGSPKYPIEKLQSIQDHAARLVCRCSKLILIVSQLSFGVCICFLSVRELITRFLLFVSELLNQVLPLTSLICCMFTLPPVSFVLHLMIDFSVFPTLEQSRMVIAFSLVRELPPGTSSHSR